MNEKQKDDKHTKKEQQQVERQEKRLRKWLETCKDGDCVMRVCVRVRLDKKQQRDDSQNECHNNETKNVKSNYRSSSALLLCFIYLLWLSHRFLLSLIQCRTGSCMLLLLLLLLLLLILGYHHHV